MRKMLKTPEDWDILENNGELEVCFYYFKLKDAKKCIDAKLELCFPLGNLIENSIFFNNFSDEQITTMRESGWEIDEVTNKKN